MASPPAVAYRSTSGDRGPLRASRGWWSKQTSGQNKSVSTDSSIETKAQALQHFSRSSLPAFSEPSFFRRMQNTLRCGVCKSLTSEREIHFSPNVAEFCGNCYFGYLFCAQVIA